VSAGKKRSLSLWIPFLWYAAVSTRGISGWFTLGQTDLAEFDYAMGSPMDRNFYLTLIIAGVIILVRKRIQWGKIIRSNPWLFWILVYTFISILWSNFPLVAFKRWIKLIGSVVVGLVVLTEYPQVDSISTVLRRCFLVHIPLDVLLVKYFRTIGVDWDYTGREMWIGLTKQKNPLGQICMTAGIYFIWDVLKKLKEGIVRYKINILYLLMIFYLLAGPTAEGRSVTSIVILLIGLFALFGMQFAPKNRTEINRFFIKGTIVLVLIFIVLSLGMGAFNETISGEFLRMTGRDETLTGRTELWEDMLQIGKKHPIRGVGFGSFWIGDKANNLWERHIWRPQEGHNGYIDIYVALGGIGLILFGLFLVSTFSSIKEMVVEDFEFGVFRMVFFIMILLHNLAESSFLRSEHNLWFLFLLIAMNVPDPVESRGATDDSETA